MSGTETAKIAEQIRQSRQAAADANRRRGFNPDQVERMLRPIRPGRVYTANGQSHVAAWDITAHLTRMFGFGGWEKEILSLEMISCARGPDIGVSNKDGWYVTYRCLMRLRIRDEHGDVVCEIDDGATGTAQNQPSLGDAHDFAMKNAISYALKRCAKDLGDQFGLSLYNKGLATAVVGTTLVGRGAVDSAPEPDHTVEGEDHDPNDPGRPFTEDEHAAQGSLLDGA